MYIISVKAKTINFEHLGYCYGYASYIKDYANAHFGSDSVVNPVFTREADGCILFKTIEDARKWINDNKEMLISTYSSEYDLNSIHILQVKDEVCVNIIESKTSITKHLDYCFNGSINCTITLETTDNRITLKSSYGEIIKENIDIKDLEKFIDDLENGKYA